MASALFKNLKDNLITVVIIASLIGAGYLTASDAREAKEVSKINTADIQEIKTKQARFEGMIDERTKNTKDTVDKIYKIVMEWEPHE